MNLPPVVSADEWKAAEKCAPRRRSTCAPGRARGPATPDADGRVRPGYTFEGAGGATTLLDLFEGRRQLVVYQFMSGAGLERPRAAPLLMFTDQVGELAHLHARDTTMANVSAVAATRTSRRCASAWAGRCRSTRRPDDFAADCGTAEWLRPQRVPAATATASSAPTSPATGASRRSAPSGRSSTAPRSGARRTWEDTPAGRPQTAPYQWWRLHDEYEPGELGPQRLIGD